MGSNRARIGHSYAPESFTVTREIAAAYAAATDDANPRYPDVAPPISAVIYAMGGALAKVAGDTELLGDPSRLLRLLHGEQEIRWHRLVRAGDTVVTTGFVKDIQEKATGELLEIGTRSTIDGELASEMTWGLFIRERSGSKERANDEKHPEPTKPAPAFETRWTVAADQSLRYAEASGDHNPIHTSDDMARMAGLRGKILHGLCTMAFAQRAAIDGWLGGDPARLARMRVRFTKPVYPGDTLTFAAWNVEPHLLAFEVRTGDGTVVLKDGVAESRTAS